MKGIILAGGTGSRLFPITKSVSKQLLPIYNKPLIYYPLSVLMMAGIKDILIITTPDDQQNFFELLKDGSYYGINLTYAIQPEPNGLAEAFLIGEKFIGNDSVCLILGDNFIYGSNLQQNLSAIKEDVENNNYAYIVGYDVNNPTEFGVAEIDKKGNVLSIEEKPIKPKSNTAVIGLYFYPNDVISKAKSIKPSDRGELEITALNNEYVKTNNIKLKKLSRGYVWFDTGNPEDLIQAGLFVRAIEQKSGLGIAVLEEISITMGYIELENVNERIKNEKSQYYSFLKEWIHEYLK